MKVVYASTPDQIEKIKELVGYFYSNIFPHYFSDRDIRSFDQSKVLDLQANDFEVYNTLKESFQVITSLNTLIVILESSRMDAKHETLFYKNVSVLNDCGLSFPFEFSQFNRRIKSGREQLSVYKQPINTFII